MLNLLMMSLWIRFRAAPESISTVKSIKVLSVDSRIGKVNDLVGRGQNCSTLTRVVILVFLRALCGHAMLWWPVSPQ